MGSLRAVEKEKNPQPTELSQLKEELRRISEKLEFHKGGFAEALEPYVHNLKPDVETELPGSKTLQAISDACALLLPPRQVTTM
jgi:hypothetical protein